MTTSRAMPFDLYVWSAPRDLDADRAEALLAAWHEAGGDPAASPFEPSTDVGWFHRELRKDAPELELLSDAVPNTSRLPIVVTPDNEPPARVVAIRLSPDTPREVLDSIFGLGAKYDLVVFAPHSRRLHLPLEEMAAYASATFWPGGAIQAMVAGGFGAVMAVVAWVVGIPILSGVLIAVGLFLFLGALYTFVHEGRRAIRGRSSPQEPPTG